MSCDGDSRADPSCRLLLSVASVVHSSSDSLLVQLILGFSFSISVNGTTPESEVRGFTVRPLRTTPHWGPQCADLLLSLRSRHAGALSSLSAPSLQTLCPRTLQTFFPRTLQALFPLTLQTLFPRAL